MSEKIVAVIIYLAIINLAGVVACISDKRRAKKGKWRIKESTLWTIALMGGAAGGYISMKSIRHKTKHKSFMIGFPALIIAQAIAIACILIKLGSI